MTIFVNARLTHLLSLTSLAKLAKALKVTIAEIVSVET